MLMKMYALKGLKEIRKFLNLADNPTLHIALEHKIACDERLQGLVAIGNTEEFMKASVEDYFPLAEFRMTEAQLSLSDTLLTWQQNVVRIRDLMSVVIRLNSGD